MTVQIKVLGPGCARCQTLFENTVEAVGRLGLDAHVEKVEDVAAMVSRGILASPALLVNDELVLAGHVATPRKIGELLAASTNQGLRREHGRDVHERVVTGPRVGDPNGHTPATAS